MGAKREHSHRVRGGKSREGADANMSIGNSFTKKPNFSITYVFSSIGDMSSA